MLPFHLPSTGKIYLAVLCGFAPLRETGISVLQALGQRHGNFIFHAKAQRKKPIPAKVPIAVAAGDADALDDAGVTCSGTRSTSTVKKTSISLNKWINEWKK
ncbi:TPA: hypothetical protein DDW35_08965 [Candidatus Sumerlaeota bacterium]|nr:hypothetical protein [Candidatus Sumerlaeota bacterium]